MRSSGGRRCIGDVYILIMRQGRGGLKMKHEELKVFRTTLTPTVRGAISKVRRWFYATFYSKERGEVREASKENWTRLARILVEKTGEAGVSDKAGRISLYYYVKDGVFIPVKAEVDIYEMRPVGRIEVDLTSSEA